MRRKMKTFVEIDRYAAISEEGFPVKDYIIHKW